MNRYGKKTFFSFSRFGKLLYKEISENWKLYALRTLMMYGVLAIVLIWAGYSEYKSYNPLFSFDDLNVRVTTLVTWMWAWWGFISLGTSFAFESMKSKTRRITNLMVPATTLRNTFSLADLCAYPSVAYLLFDGVGRLYPCICLLNDIFGNTFHRNDTI